MSQLTDFIAYFTSISNTILNYTITAIFATIILLITVTELMKTFNPNIATTKEAIDHIVTKLKEDEGKEHDSSDLVGLTYIGQALKETRLDFMLVPMFGLLIVMTIGDTLFPQISARWLETAMTYYVPIVPYIFCFAILYMVGVAAILTFKAFGLKTFELIIILSDKIKETVKEEQKQ